MQIQSNTANSFGGGLFCRSSTLVLENTIINKNGAKGISGSGGGIFCTSASLVLKNVTINNNGTLGNSSSGGGIAGINSSFVMDYPVGTYIVKLVCEGKVVDTKTFVRQ